MRPLLLKGHERSITYVQYNHDGDLLFSTSKDNRPSLWRSDNGERIGTYDGHNGAVWRLDVSRDSKLLLTCSADMTVKLWAVETGECLFTYEHRGPVRDVVLADGDRSFFSLTDPFAGVPASLSVYDLPSDLAGLEDTPTLDITRTELPKMGAFSCGLWLPANKGIMVGSTDGFIRVFDPASGEQVQKVAAHSDRVMCMAYDKHRIMFATASRDFTAKLFDLKTMDVLRVIETDRPVNAIAISPIMHHVMLGGGQEAITVTTTAARAGKFEVRFFNTVFTEEFGRVKGHFGPINTLAFHPDGTSFVSGAEDGYIRLHHFDRDYLSMGRKQEREFEEYERLEREERERREAAGFGEGAEEAKA